MDKKGLHEFKLCKDDRLRRKKEGIEAKAEECVKNMRDMAGIKELGYDLSEDVSRVSDELERIAPSLGGYEKLANND